MPMAVASDVGLADAQLWWEPGTFYMALATALVSTVCWGSWSNTAKVAADVMNFGHFYADFVLGVLLSSFAFFVGPGALHLGGLDVDINRCAFALAAGAIFAVANLILTTGIALAGLSVAFPICIGTGLVLGTLLTYLVDKRGQPVFIFPGVVLALLGVLANARAYAALQKARLADSNSESSGSESDASDSDSSDTVGKKPSVNHSFTQLITLCIVGGLLMGCWAPFSARSMGGPAGLSPYASFACFCVANFIVSISILGAQQLGCTVIPRVDDATNLKKYFMLPPQHHVWGLLGGFIWSLGTVANLVSGEPLGFALSYALGQTAPVVAVLWGLLWYHEFDGAPCESVVYLVLMFVLFISAVAMLIIAGC